MCLCRQQIKIILLENQNKFRNNETETRDRDGVCREPLTSARDSALSLLLLLYKHSPSLVVKHSLAYISLIKSKAAGPHTSDPICGLFCALPLSFSLFFPSCLPSFSRGLTLRLFYLLQRESFPKPIPLSVRPANYTRSWQGPTKILYLDVIRMYLMRFISINKSAIDIENNIRLKQTLTRYMNYKLLFSSIAILLKINFIK